MEFHPKIRNSRKNRFWDFLGFFGFFGIFGARNGFLMVWVGKILKSCAKLQTVMYPQYSGVNVCTRNLWPPRPWLQRKQLPLPPARLSWDAVCGAGGRSLRRWQSSSYCQPSCNGLGLDRSRSAGPCKNESTISSSGLAAPQPCWSGSQNHLSRGRCDTRCGGWQGP